MWVPAAHVATVAESPDEGPTIMISQLLHSPASAGAEERRELSNEKLDTFWESRVAHNIGFPIVIAGEVGQLSVLARKSAPGKELLGLVYDRVVLHAAVGVGCPIRKNDVVVVFKGANGGWPPCTTVVRAHSVMRPRTWSIWTGLRHV